MLVNKDQKAVQGLIQVRLPIEISDKITRLALDEGITAGQWIARAVKILVG